MLQFKIIIHLNYICYEEYSKVLCQSSYTGKIRFSVDLIILMVGYFFFSIIILILSLENIRNGVTFGFGLICLMYINLHLKYSCFLILY